MPKITFVQKVLIVLSSYQKVSHLNFDSLNFRGLQTSTLGKTLQSSREQQGESMSNFRIEKPFDTKPPRLKDLVNEHVMGDVWIRDTPFGPVTDSLKIAEHFEMEHKNILRATDKCLDELSIQLKFELNKNFLENHYLGGAKVKRGKLERWI